MFSNQRFGNTFINNRLQFVNYLKRKTFVLNLSALMTQQEILPLLYVKQTVLKKKKTNKYQN